MDKNAIHYVAEIDNLKGSLAVAQRRLEQFAQDIAYKLGLPYEPPVEKGDCRYLKGIEDLKERAERAEAERDQLRAALEAVEWGGLRCVPNDEGMDRACPSCDAFPTQGHEPDCQLHAALNPPDCQRQAALGKREQWVSCADCGMSFPIEALTSICEPCQRQAALGGEKGNKMTKNENDNDPLCGLPVNRPCMVRDQAGDICGVICPCGPKGEPIACGFLPDHDGPHSWARLPTFLATPRAAALAALGGEEGEA